MNIHVVEVQLHSWLVDVNVRIGEFDGLYLISADAADGPSLGMGTDLYDALVIALQPFQGVIVELLDDMWSEDAEADWES